MRAVSPHPILSRDQGAESVKPWFPDLFLLELLLKLHLPQKLAHNNRYASFYKLIMEYIDHYSEKLNNYK